MFAAPPFWSFCFSFYIFSISCKIKVVVMSMILLFIYWSQMESSVQKEEQILPIWLKIHMAMPMLPATMM